MASNQYFEESQQLLVELRSKSNEIGLHFDYKYRTMLSQNDENLKNMRENMAKVLLC